MTALCGARGGAGLGWLVGWLVRFGWFGLLLVWGWKARRVSCLTFCVRSARVFCPRLRVGLVYDHTSHNRKRS